MEFQELTTDTLQDLVAENEKVVVQYGATWCGNCRITKPKFKRMAAEHEDMQFVYVDAEKLPNSRALADVKNLPTFASFSNGQLVKQQATNKVEIINDIVNAVASN